MRRSRFRFQPISTNRVTRQTLQSLWGSAFASGANTGQPGKELVGKTRRVQTKRTTNFTSVYIYIYIYIYMHAYIICVYIYIYISLPSEGKHIHIYTCIYIYIYYICISLSLSLYIYIYIGICICIYTYIHTYTRRRQEMTDQIRLEDAVELQVCVIYY